MSFKKGDLVLTAVTSIALGGLLTCVYLEKRIEKPKYKYRNPKEIYKPGMSLEEFSDKMMDNFPNIKSIK